MSKRLKEKYSSSAVLKVLHVRYGLNALGIKQILKIKTRRYNLLVKGAENLNGSEARILTETFEELEGRFYYE